MIDLQLAAEGTPADVEGAEIAERKLDGVRAVAIDGQLFTRSGRDITANFPDLSIPDGVIDGELVTDDGAFSSINRRVQVEDEFKIEVLSKHDPAMFVAFDVLEHDGEDLRDWTWTERSAVLATAVRPYAGVVPIEPHHDPVATWEAAKSKGWEGVVLKDPSRPYEGDRTDAWIKVKVWREETLPILRHEVTDNDGFVIYVDAGADDPQRVVVNGEQDQRAIRAGADRAEIQYLERTDEDRLRKPSFKGTA